MESEHRDPILAPEGLTSDLPHDPPQTPQNVPQPTPVEPVSVEPAPVEPTPVEPAPVEPTPVEPASVEPPSVEPISPQPGYQRPPQAASTVYQYDPQSDAVSAQRKREKKPSSHRGLKIAALLLCCALIGGGAGLGGALLANKLTPPVGGAVTLYEGGGTPEVIDLSKIDAGQSLTPAEVYAANANSVVGIKTQVTTNIWGQQVAQAASGSGFVISADGYIVTNYHVIDEATSINVIFKNGDSYPATLVGGEEENDLAVLKIQAGGLTPVVLGSSDALVVGQQVTAIGNPLGEMTFSQTVGYVSALDKPLTMSDGTILNVLQTDCAINSGNSGGALFNTYGQVVGITNAKYSNNGFNSASIEGICFAIPIDDIKDMIQDIILHGYVTGKPYVGATVATVNAEAAARYARPGGAYIQNVTVGTAADKAGLRQGDIVTAIDGEPVSGHADFLAIRDKHKAGDTVTLTVDREARTITLTMTYGEQKPTDNAAQIIQGSGGQSGSGGNGYNYPNPFSWFGW